MNTKHHFASDNEPDGAERLLRHLKGVVQSGSGWMSLCPAHPDSNQSLHVNQAPDGKILVHCFAGCKADDVMQALGLTTSFLRGNRIDAARGPARKTGAKSRGWDSPQSAADHLANKGVGTIESIHDYPDLDGLVRFVVVRFKTPTGKTFRPLHLREGRWHVGDPDRLLPLYCLTGVTTAPMVLLFEGEKCVDYATKLGAVATTSAHGAQSAKNTDWTRLKGKKVYIAPDADQSGLAYAAEVASILRTIDPEAEILHLELPGLAEGEDIFDWGRKLKDAGQDDEAIAASLNALMASAQPWSATHSTYFTDIAGRVGTSESWPAPRPIAKVADPPAFPIEQAYPASCARLKEFVLAVAESYQVPVDLPAMLSLAAFGLPLSRTIEVSPQPDWREPLAIYVISLLASGERKSPVFAKMFDPIRDWQRQREMSMQLGIASAENDIKVMNERIAIRRSATAKGKTISDGDSMESLIEQLKRLEANKPRPPAMIASEATTEAIADLLVENQERGMIAAAEGDTLDVMLGRYSNGRPNFGLWLSGHAGDSIDIRRKGRPTLRLARPALTVALAVQPEAISELLGSKAAAGRGVLARFFFSRPKSLLGFRKLRPDRIPTDTLDWYGARLHQLLDRPVPDQPLVLTLSKEADDLFLDFRRWVEDELRPDGYFSDHTAWGAKLAGAVARIAGVLHAVGDPELRSTEISHPTMTSAIAWAEYLEAHERHVAWLAGDNSASSIAERILKWLGKEQRSEVTHNEVFNGVRGSRVQTAKDIDPALHLLEELGWIRTTTPPQRTGPGRPPGNRFRVHPSVAAGTSHPSPQYTQNTQNGPGTDDTHWQAGGGSQ